MAGNKDDVDSRDRRKQGRPTVSRRDFARTTMAAGAAATIGIPTAASSRAQSTGSSRSGTVSTRDNEHRAGTTIPGEYYYDAEHYKKDERYVAENFWLLADHVSRIPEPGDYFVFKMGLGESAIVVRGESGEIRAFNNVCRHRGSRLCRHNEDQRSQDARLSVRQLGESGNAKVFRCPYHAWMYDIDGSLIEAYDVADEFDMSENGLIPCHILVDSGHIFLNFSRSNTPPAFDAVSTYGLSRLGTNYRMADLKIGAREAYLMKANWKLALENFLECYHCGPAHENLVTTHHWDYDLSDNRQRRRDSQVAEWLGPERAEIKSASAGGPYDGELNPGFLTGSVDGDPLAPLLPGITEWTHTTDLAITGYSTGYWQAYDDYVAVARFTPRGPELTDTEIWWLVHPDAEAGKDFDRDELMALWDITIKEDAWIVENNHVGIKSAGYRSGQYTVHESEPSEFASWYMREIVNA